MPSTTAAIHFLESDEDRTTRALAAMQGLETMLEQQPHGALLPAADIHALAVLVNDAVRDVLLWEPPQVANDR